MTAAGVRAHPSLLQEIVEQARTATRVRWVHLLHYDAQSGRVWAGPSARFAHPALQRLAGLAAGVAPGFHPGRLEFAADVNPWVRRIYLEGRPVCAPMREVAAGTVDARLLELACTVGGLSHTYSSPLRVEGRVVGALAFHHARPFGPQLRRACEALVRLAALAVERDAAVRRLEAAVAELAASRRVAVESAERVRREVAYALHGRVQTRLLVAWHRLGQVQARLDPASPAHAELGEVRELLDRLREEDVRHLSHALHPAVIRAGLLPAVRSLADAAGGTAAVEVRASPAVVFRDGPAGPGFPEALRLALYRILEAALGNACRHAGAAHVEVELHTDGERLRAVVRDDGAGFDPRAVSPGLGLKTIALLAEAHGGRWAVESAPGRGTRVEVELPL
ncbi:MAG: GAF domain-containing protein [Firmicutes bacterium]|nr:GAF domain-containing protein [Bacillota bacterium]